MSIIKKSLGTLDNSLIIKLKNMKETQEIVDAIFNTIAVGIKEFDDGVQWTDLGAIVPAALSWNKAIEGIKEFENEVLQASSLDIDILFNSQSAKLVDAGIDPLLAQMLVTELKGKFLLYVYITKRKTSKPAPITAKAVDQKLRDM